MSNTLDPDPFVSEAVASQPKRIVVCCDGTWQSSVSLDPKKGVESNVTRLCRILAKAGTDKDGKVWEQVVYYDAGVGTGEITKYDQNLQGGLGIGLTENVIEAYNFVVNNYKKGDELFFFGFSRGAYTVRAAAGLVGTLGVLKPSSMNDFIKQYAEFKKTPEGRPQFDAYPPWVQYTKNNPNYYVETRENTVVQVIGVWDTVGALGVPELGHFWTMKPADKQFYEFYDTNLNDGIKHAFQALALDERRPAFTPTVWRLKNNGTTQLLQCWFPGAHINCGGGNNENLGPNPTGDKEQLASISYAWMLDRIRPHLAFDAKALDEQFKPFDDLADTPFKPDEPSGWWDWAKKKVLPAGYARGQINDSFSAPWWLLTFPKDRTPNRYHNPAAGEVTEEQVHPSVHYRRSATIKWREPLYEPAAMREWTRVWEANGKGRDGKPKSGWMWVKYIDDDRDKGYENSLWEFEIGHMAKDKSLEKRLIDGSWIEEVHDEVRRSWKGVNGKE